MQISLERMAAPEGDLQALLDRFEAESGASYPAPQCRRMASGATVGLAVFDIQVGNEPIGQLHLLLADEAPQDEDGRPEWAREAYALESQDRLEEAEQTMRQCCDHIGVLISIAEMYRQRMLRLVQAGDVAGAAHALRSSPVETWPRHHQATRRT